MTATIYIALLHISYTEKNSVTTPLQVSSLGVKYQIEYNRTILATIMAIIVGTAMGIFLYFYTSSHISMAWELLLVLPEPALMWSYSGVICCFLPVNSAYTFSSHASLSNTLVVKMRIANSLFSDESSQENLLVCGHYSSDRYASAKQRSLRCLRSIKMVGRCASEKTFL